MGNHPRPRHMIPIEKKDLTKVNNYLWEIQKSFRSDMLVPARIYASEKLLDDMFGDRCLPQLINVATLPGIVEAAYVMPDAHEGYGFPVGGVAAFDPDDGGIISPGGIGYDINCGVRLLATPFTKQEVEGQHGLLGKTLYQEIPSGVGHGGKLNLNEQELDLVLKNGAPHLISTGFGFADDAGHLESGGMLPEADPSLVSVHAKNRGRDQLGTMGAGNHFVEVDVVEKVFDNQKADSLGLKPDQVVVLIHTGSRGLGHQIATDYIKTMMHALPKYNINLPDRELACAPFSSKEGQNYFKAMSAGANFAWANRQLITHEVRASFQKVFHIKPEELKIIYDVAHNIAKLEEYRVGGVKKKLIVHRKGATRSFPNQPVLIPGSMGTSSYVLTGEEGSLTGSFGSSCHGAGRRMSRTEAKHKVFGKELREKMEAEGIAVSAGSTSGLAEEAPVAYKDVDEVVDVIHNAGLASKLVRLKPLVVVKG